MAVIVPFISTWDGKGLMAARADLAASGRQLQTVGRLGQQVGGVLTKGLTVPILAVGAAGLVAGMDYAKGARVIQQQTGASGKQLGEYKRSFDAVYQTVPEEAGAVASAIATIGQRTGVTGSLLDGLSRQSVNLARVTGSDLKEQVVLTERAMASWNVTADEQGAKMDFLYAEAQKTGATYDQLAGGMIDFGPAMRAFNLSFEQGAVLLGSFEKAGVNTAITTKSLTMALRVMSKEGIKDPAAALPGLIAKIKDAKTEGDAGALAFKYFGRSGVNMLDAIRRGKVDLSGLNASLGDTTGWINKTADATLPFGQQLLVTWHMLEAGLQPLGATIISMRGDLIPVMRTGVAIVKNLGEAFASLPPEARRSAVWAGLIVAGVGPAISGISGVVGAVGKINSATAGAIPQLFKTSTALKSVGDSGYVAAGGANAASGGATTGIIGLGAAITVLNAKLQQTTFDKMGSDLGKLGTALGVNKTQADQWGKTYSTAVQVTTPFGLQNLVISKALDAGWKSLTGNTAATKGRTAAVSAGTVAERSNKTAVTDTTASLYDQTRAIRDQTRTRRAAEDTHLSALQAEQAEADAQTHVNDLIKAGKTKTLEYRIAVAELIVAKRNHKDATGKDTEAQAAHNRAIARNRDITNAAKDATKLATTWVGNYAKTNPGQKNQDGTITAFNGAYTAIKQAQDRLLSWNITKPKNKTVTVTQQTKNVLSSLGVGGANGAAPGGKVGDELAFTAGFSGVPYKWGGTSRSGVDCSGLTTLVAAHEGVAIPRTAASQWAQFNAWGRATQNGQPGDFAYFGNPVHHTGVYLGNGRMWEAPYTGARVRIGNAARHDLRGFGRLPGFSSGGVRDFGREMVVALHGLEAVVPLAANKASERARVMAQAGLGGNVIHMSNVFYVTGDVDIDNAGTRLGHKLTSTLRAQGVN